MACPMRFVLLGISLILAAFAWFTISAEHEQHLKEISQPHSNKVRLVIQCIH